MMMDIATLTSFFGWMTVINVGVLIFAAVMFRVMGDVVYEVRSKIFPLDREWFNKVTYASVTLYKVLVIVFNVVPYIALTLVA